MNKTNVQIRIVTPEEKMHISRLQSLAFNFSLDEKDIRDKIDKGEYNSDNTYGAVDANGNVLAGMEAIPFTMWFDGNKVPTTGIGGVVTAPEYRRGGNIKSIFRKVFDDSYENGVVFSHLYPFSHAYYRMYGYEHVGASMKYTLPIDAARTLRQSGQTFEYIKSEAPDELTKQIIDVYESFASRHNVMLSRSPEKWNDILNITLFSGDRLYFWRGSDSEIRSWVKLEKTRDQLVVKDIAWKDKEAMFGILQFLGMYEGSVEKMTLTTSSEFAPEIFWPNLYTISAERTNWLGMSRIISVKRAFELMKKPDIAGKVIISVQDEFAAWNNRKYQIEFDHSECSINETTKEPDIELTQNALVQLMLGVYEPELIFGRNDINLASNKNLLLSLFPKKKILLKDFF